MWGSGIRSVYEVPDLFSDGERTHILSGIYNPDYLETIGRWNREGITALVPEADPDRIGQLWDSRPEYSTLGTDSLEYKMIHGFGGESILDYPINDIAEAKNTLEQIVREAFPENPALASWNVENAF